MYHIDEQISSFHTLRSTAIVIALKKMNDCLRVFHLVRTLFYMLSGRPPLLFFACYTQWKCIGDLTPPPPQPHPPRRICNSWKAP